MVGYESFKLQIFRQLSANPEYEPQVEVYIDLTALTQLVSLPAPQAHHPTSKVRQKENRVERFLSTWQGHL